LWKMRCCSAGGERERRTRDRGGQICNMMQCDAIWCNVMQCDAMYCSFGKRVWGKMRQTFLLKCIEMFFWHLVLSPSLSRDASCNSNGSWSLELCWWSMARRAREMARSFLRPCTVTKCKGLDWTYETMKLETSWNILKQLHTLNGRMKQCCSDRVW
jgi:hypothetical protein